MAGPGALPLAALRASVVVLAVLSCAGCGSHSETPRSRDDDRGGDRPKHVALPPVTAPVARTVRVPVLTYHRVHRYQDERAKSIPDLTVEPDVFERSIAAIKRRGFRSVTNRQVYGALFKGRPLPPKPVLITVDDGYRDAMTNVLPVLRRHGMTATFFVITGRLGGDEYLTKEDVRRLEAAGMDIGGHTSSHRDLTTVPQTELQRETAGSRRNLARILRHPVYFFAYPFGRYDANVVAEVRRSGYSVAFTTESGTRLSSTAALTQPRMHVGRNATPPQVVAYAEQNR
jgi:peptidoglycan/xylan/chitin deacetylase (PgdA/CDA1 family)